MEPSEGIDDWFEHEASPMSGAKVVARAWTDDADRRAVLNSKRSIRNGRLCPVSGSGESARWKCRWGSLLLPELPTRPISWRFVTRSPGRTDTEPGRACA